MMLADATLWLAWKENCNSTFSVLVLHSLGSIFSIHRRWDCCGTRNHSANYLFFCVFFLTFHCHYQLVTIFGLLVVVCLLRCFLPQILFCYAFSCKTLSLYKRRRVELIHFEPPQSTWVWFSKSHHMIFLTRTLNILDQGTKT